MRRSALSVGLMAFSCLLRAPAAGAQAPDYPNTSAMGSVADRNADWYRQCVRVRDVQPPEREAPPAAALHGLRQCRAEERYYDTRERPDATPAEWEKVRHCAYAESNAEVQMMLYANGYGVSRNYDLALKYACSVQAAPAEMDGRVAHLIERAQHHEAQPFDLCDDITSGLMSGRCAAIQDRLDSRARGARLETILKTWPPAPRAALDKLQQALERFASARADAETDMSGTARSALAIEAHGTELELFAHDLQDAEKGKLPRYTEQQFQQLDKKLNALYQRLMEQPPGPDDKAGAEHLLGGGTVTRDGVRATQRAWLAYRDAWVALGATRYPSVPAHAWKALLTQRRIDQLDDFES